MTNYEHGTKIPLMIGCAGGGCVGRSSALVEAVDIYPTLLEEAGILVRFERWSKAGEVLTYTNAARSRPARLVSRIPGIPSIAPKGVHCLDSSETQMKLRISLRRTRNFRALNIQPRKLTSAVETTLSPKRAVLLDSARTDVQTRWDTPFERTTIGVMVFLRGSGANAKN